MAKGRRLLTNVPILSRRSWEDVAPELERFLKRLWESEGDGIPAGFGANTTPTTVAAGATGTPGTGNTSGWAAADHQHPVVTGVPSGLDNANAAGTSSAIPRLDHKHKRDVRVQSDDSDVGTRNAINFTGAPVVTDDPGGDQVNVFVPDAQNKHGFAVADNGDALVNLTYDKTTRKVTFTPVGATYTVYIDGVEFVKTGAQVSPAHAATDGKHFFYYDSSGNLQVSTTPWGIRDRTVTPAALVFYSTSLSDGICFFECHTADRWLEGHYNLHFTRGTQYISGIDITGYTLTTDTDAGVTFALSSGVVADEDIRWLISGRPDGGPYTVMYRTGAAGDWIWDSTPVLPFLYGTYPQYNNPNGGGPGVWGMTDIGGGGTGEYVNYFVVAVTSIDSLTQLILIPSQTKHTSLAAAQGESVSSLQWGTVPFEEVKGIWKVTFRARSSYGGTAQTRIESVASLKAENITVTGAAGVTDHGSLTGRSAADQHPASAITDFIPSRGGAFFNPSGITGGANVIVWRAPYACEVTNVRGYRVGGTGATINARQNGASNHLASALSLTSADTWLDGGAVQNVTYAAGDKLEVMLVTVSGSPTQVAIQVDFRRI